MADHESTESGDAPPVSSTRPLDRLAFDGICAILQARFEVHPRDVHLDSRFVEDLGIDVFDVPDLILALEEVFEIDIPVPVAARILTVRDALRVCP